MPHDLSDHLQDLRDDIRGEIKQRIEQRDKYSIQLTIAVAAVCAFAFSEYGTSRLLFAAPIASLYYTVLILYSYSVHDILAAYLRDVVEPMLARQHNINVDVEWESHYATQHRPGIRRDFFLWAHWVVLIATCGLALIDRIGMHEDPVMEVLLTCVIVIASMAVARHGFWTKPSAIAPLSPSGRANLHDESADA